MAKNKTIHLISASQCITPPNIINANFNALFVIVSFDKFKNSQIMGQTRKRTYQREKVYNKLKKQCEEIGCPLD